MGGSGDGDNIISTLHAMNAVGHNVTPIGYLNDFAEKDSYINEIRVYGRINDAHHFLSDPNIYFISSILKATKNHIRVPKIDKLGIPINRFFSAVHPSAAISHTAEIGKGVHISAHTTVNSYAKIGNHCSLRASSNIGHDCYIDSFSYVGPNSTLCGRCRIGKGVHIGPNAAIIEDAHIGDYAVIGIGAIVLKNVPEFAISVGNPAKTIRIINKD